MISLPIRYSKYKEYAFPSLNPILVDGDPSSEDIEWLNSQPVLAFDIECTGLLPFEDRVLAILLGTDTAQYIFWMEKIYDYAPIMAILSNKKVKKVGHFLKYDMKFIMHHYGVEINNIWDTYTYERLITNGLPDEETFNFKLKGGMAQKYFNIRYSTEAVSGFIDRQENKKFTKSEITYMANDLMLPFVIYYAQLYGVETFTRGGSETRILGFDKISGGIPGFDKIVDLEMLFVKEIARIELNGFYLDKKIWVEETRKAQIEFKRLETEIKDDLIERNILKTGKVDRKRKEAMRKNEPEQLILLPDVGPEDLEAKPRFYNTTYIIVWKNGSAQVEEFNLQSNDHVGQALNLLGFPVSSTGIEVLEDLKGADPIIDKIIDYRSYSKLTTSYGNKMLEHQSKVTGRIHADFEPYYKSGRITPREPNLAQIPQPAHGVNFRKAFTAPPGYKIITADLSACEVRIIAQLSEDPAIIKQLNDGADIHKYIASMIYQVEQEKISHDQRSLAKRVVFGYAYGAGAATIARQAKCSTEDAREFMNKFDTMFPNIANTFKMLRENVIRDGFVTTIAGRPRFFEIPTYQLYFQWAQPWHRTYERAIKSIQRQAGNHPIQGTNADAMKLSVINLSREIRRNGWDARIVNLVHDEQVVEVHESIAVIVAEAVKRNLEEALGKFVTLVPSESKMTIGECWEK